MEAKDETSLQTLKIIKNLPLPPPPRLQLQKSEMLETSYSSTPAQPPQRQKFMKMASVANLTLSYRKNKTQQPAPAHQPESPLDQSKLDGFESRSRINSQTSLNSDAHREAMKARLEGRVQEAERKLQEMKLGFKRRVEEKHEIFKKRDSLKPPLLHHH